jgi:hypothetical protein
MIRCIKLRRYQKNTLRAFVDLAAPHIFHGARSKVGIVSGRPPIMIPPALDCRETAA